MILYFIQNSLTRSVKSLISKIRNNPDDNIIRREKEDEVKQECSFKNECSVPVSNLEKTMSVDDSLFRGGNVSPKNGRNEIYSNLSNSKQHIVYNK